MGSWLERTALPAIFSSCCVPHLCCSSSRRMRALSRSLLCSVSWVGEVGIRLGTRRKGPALPCPGTHPQPLLLQLCGSLQQLLLQL